MLDREAPPESEPEIKSESILFRLSQQLTALEHRDFEQWVIVVVTGFLVGAGLMAILFPSAILCTPPMP